MFSFANYPQLIHEGIPQEMFLVLPFTGNVPSGIVSFHPAFMQLPEVEKDIIADVIIDYAIAGVKVDLKKTNDSKPNRKRNFDGITGQQSDNAASNPG
jgi:hypothetical protein